MQRFLLKLKIFIHPLMDKCSQINLLSFSIISFFVIGLNFLPLITKLGFYLDEWPELYSWNVRGLEGIRQYWIADSRTFTWWVHGIFFPLFGSKAILWHIFAVITRWITTILFWLVFTKIWPKQKIQVTAAALLFGIYPLFAQQSSGLLYTIFWICFILYLASLLLMVQSYRYRKWFFLFTFLGLAFDLVNLLTCEYFIGVELLRPVIFFLLINSENISKGKKLLRTFLYSLPWLVLDLGYFVWRAFLFKTPTLRPIQIFENLQNSPVQTIIQLLQNFIKDFIQIVVSIWDTTLAPSLFDLQIPSDLLAWGLAFIVFVFVVLYFLNLSRSKSSDTESFSHDAVWYKHFLFLGFLTVILGVAPSWAIGKTVSAETGIWNDRYGMVSMFGAGLFITSLIWVLVKPSPKKFVVIVSVLLALATGSNFRNTNDYRWSTTYQTRFYNQLHWRAPSIKANTTFFSGREFFPKMGVYPTSFALNLMYPSVNPMPKVDYWFYTILHYFPNNYHELDDGIELNLQKWYVEYSGLSTDSLVIHWDYLSPSCLWVLDENDRYNPYIVEEEKEILGASNLSRITTEEHDGYPPEEIFGSEEPHGWCYYFEKADLAKQNHEWSTVTALYEEAGSKGFKTNYAPELTPFIFGYALSGNVERAIELTDISKTLAEKMKPYLCDQWTTIYNLSEPSQAIIDAYQREMSDLSCGL